MGAMTMSFKFKDSKMAEGLNVGDKVPVTLQFERAGKVDVTFDVQAVGAQRPAAGHGH